MRNNGKYYAKQGQLWSNTTHRWWKKDFFFRDGTHKEKQSDWIFTKKMPSKWSIYWFFNSLNMEKTKVKSKITKEKFVILQNQKAELEKEFTEPVFIDIQAERLYIINDDGFKQYIF